MMDAALLMPLTEQVTGSVIGQEVANVPAGMSMVLLTQAVAAFVNAVQLLVVPLPTAP
jgi:hypothetical protein